MLVSLSYLYLELSVFIFPNLINKNGWFISQGLLVFGWIIVSTSVIAYFLYLTEAIEDDLKNQKSKQENLLQILLHNISNQMQIIGVGNKLLSKTETEKKELKWELRE